jgi:hypothetical protein
MAETALAPVIGPPIRAIADARGPREASHGGPLPDAGDMTSELARTAAHPCDHQKDKGHHEHSEHSGSQPR